MRPSCYLRLLALGFTAFACGDPPTPPVTVTSTGTLLLSGSRWPYAREQAALAAVRSANDQIVRAAPALFPPGVPLTPFVEARLYAIADVAMHDALNAIVPRYERFADTGPIDAGANPAAAVLTAAHDAIVGAAPAATAAADAWYASAIASVSGDGIAEGVAIGHRTANAILQLRATDGVAAGGVAPYYPGSNPGDYRFTPPFDQPPFTLIFPGTGGFADASQWATTVSPFVLQSATQFRVPPPYGAPNNAAAVVTPAYTADFREIAALGCVACPLRTAEQTEIALFWAESSPDGWNRIARTLAEQRNLDAVETARLFAVLHLAEFDSFIATLESKYYYHFWRPVTAVALAATDGNPNTTPVAAWQELLFPTPPVPDYPSAHACAGGAAEAVLEALLPGRGEAFATTSGSLPNVTRRFATVAVAARENADSRVLIGYHFRHATDVGLAQGRAVGEFVVANALRPMAGRR